MLWPGIEPTTESRKNSVLTTTPLTHLSVISITNYYDVHIVGWKADVFDWQEYLSYSNAEAAPANAFTTVRN